MILVVLIHGYKEFSTIRSLFLESRDETEDDLYTAYYERLKQLMQEALRSLLETEFHSEASRVFSVLDRTDIHRIW